MLGITVHGVRWLARHGRLTYEATASGQRLFRPSDVVRLLEQRAKSRLTGVPAARVTGLGEPHQLSLFGKARLRIVAS
jgi:DNA-binding transcriptional MerR regulator